MPFALMMYAKYGDPFYFFQKQSIFKLLGYIAFPRCSIFCVRESHAAIL